MTHPAFTSDDLSDLADAGDIWTAPAVVAAVVAPTPPSRAVVEGLRTFQCGVLITTTDPEFLRLVAPDWYLLRGQFVWAFAKGASLTGAYQAAPGARNAMRSDLHAAGVL